MGEGELNMRDGFFAGWCGQEYEASPNDDQVRLYSTEDAEGFDEVAPGRFRRVVSAEELDHLTYVITVCTWHGEPFQALGEYRGWVRVEYVGGQAPVAERLGLDLFDHGVYQAWAPRHELRNIREERI
jgi:hypothetical protein